MNKFWTLCTVLYGFLISPLGMVSALVAWFVTDFDSAWSAVDSALTTFENGIPSWSLNVSWIGQANRVFPVTASVNMVVSLVVLRVVCTGVRWIKSWLPTVN